MNAPVTPSQRAWRLLTLGLAFGVLYRLSNPVSYTHLTLPTRVAV